MCGIAGIFHPERTRPRNRMETVVRAPADGTVRELCVDVGQPVEGGDLLVALDGV